MTTFNTYETAWCPGCGNFAILDSLKTALEELGKEPHEVLMAAGIGQAANTPQYISANSFCGLHGRSLPAAIAAKIEDTLINFSFIITPPYPQGVYSTLPQIPNSFNIIIKYFFFYQ